MDFDNCITDSTSAFVKVYNGLYKEHLGFKPAIAHLVDQYDFRDQCTLIQTQEEIEQIFAMKSFFDKLEFINPNTYEVLERLNEKYQIIIVSIGTFENISLKSLWVKEHMPFIKDCIFLINDGCIMNKSIVQMQDGIFLDDVASNLVSSNSFFKIAFGETHEWNREWQGKRCLDWDRVKGMLL